MLKIKKAEVLGAFEARRERHFKQDIVGVHDDKSRLSTLWMHYWPHTNECSGRDEVKPTLVSYDLFLIHLLYSVLSRVLYVHAPPLECDVLFGMF